MELKGILSDRTPYRKFLILVGLTLMFSVLMTFAGGILAGWIYGIDIMTNPGIPEVPDDNTVAAFKMMQIFAAFGTFIIPPLIAANLFSKEPAGFLGFRKPQNLIPFLLLPIFMLGMVPLINYMLAVNARLEMPEILKAVEEWMIRSEEQAAKITEMFLETTTIRGLLLNLFMVAILPAIGEEMLFRGTIQPLFTKLTGNIHTAILLTAFLFSALHMQFYGFLPRFALGVVFGYMFYHSGNIWIPAIAHFINNAAAVIFIWINNRSGMPFDQDSIGTLPGQEIVLIASIIITAVMMMVIFRYSRWKNEDPEVAANSL